MASVVGGRGESEISIYSKALRYRIPVPDYFVLSCTRIITLSRTKVLVDMAQQLRSGFQRAFNAIGDYIVFGIMFQYRRFCHKTLR